MRRTPLNAAGFKIAICATAFFGVVASAAPASAQSCNPLTLLFGGCREARLAPALPAYEPLNVAPQASGRLNPAHVRPKKAHAARRGSAPKTVTAPRIEARPAANAPVGSLARFAADPTLRDGDIVVATEGFRVYRNNRFTAIAQDGGALAQLEKASMRPKTADIPEIVATSGERRGLVALRRAIRVASSQ